MTDIPDWVLLEAAKRGCVLTGTASASELRVCYQDVMRPLFRALCDMIAKYEQPPVDPDVEAVKRIIIAWEDWGPEAFSPFSIFYLDALNRAVVQYKKEK